MKILALLTLTVLASACVVGESKQVEDKGVGDQRIDSRRPSDGAGDVTRDGPASSDSTLDASHESNRDVSRERPSGGDLGADTTRDQGPGVDLPAADTSVDLPLTTATVAVPTTSTASSATGGYSTLFGTSARTYQVALAASALGALSSGARIVALAFRQTSWFGAGAAPASTITCGSFDIQLSSSNNAPGSLSTTFSDNIGADVVTARSGALSIAAASMPGGATHPTPNAFGADIAFSAPYTYNGGALLITIRHSGCSQQILLDSGSPACSACQGQVGTSYTATTSSGNNPAMITRLRYAP
ncbi:MAG: hypothetical protein KC503_40915 [Myxococcales bacterium]|nr:hypothetical protein [Myxococcales bacterium]